MWQQRSGVQGAEALVPEGAMDLQVSGVNGGSKGASQGPGPGARTLSQWSRGPPGPWVRGSRWLHFMVQITDKSGVRCGVLATLVHSGYLGLKCQILPLAGHVTWKSLEFSGPRAGSRRKGAHECSGVCQGGQPTKGLSYPHQPVLLLPLLRNSHR